MYKKSLKKLKEKGLFIFGLDLLHLFIALIITGIFGFILSSFILSNQTQNILNLSEINSIELASSKVTLTLIFYAIILLINYSIIKTIVWSKLLDKKREFKKFFALNTVLFVILLFSFNKISGFLAWLINFKNSLEIYASIPLYLLVIMPLLIYIINAFSILYIKFLTKKHYLIETGNELINIKKYYLSYAFLGVLFIIAGFLGNLIPGIIGFYVSVLLITAFFTYNKIFIIENV